MIDLPAVILADYKSRREKLLYKVSPFLEPALYDDGLSASDLTTVQAHLVQWDTLHLDTGANYPCISISNIRALHG